MHLDRWWGRRRLFTTSPEWILLQEIRWCCFWTNIVDAICQRQFEGMDARGREKGGPTAAILSTTSWDHSAMIGGLAYNMKFNTSLFGSPDSFDRLRDLVLTFLKRGGFETQINVVDRDTLRKAREDPDAYRDLIVRIGGYTDYFTRLSPAMQDEVMMRTEFAEM